MDSSIHGESVKMVTQFLPEEEVGCWLCIFLWTNYGLHIETVCIVNSYCKHELPFPLKALFFYYFSTSHFFKTPVEHKGKMASAFMRDPWQVLTSTLLLFLDAPDLGTVNTFKDQSNKVSTTLCCGYKTSHKAWMWLWHQTWPSFPQCFTHNRRKYGWMWGSAK